jgi:hypothetical protein
MRYEELGRGAPLVLVACVAAAALAVLVGSVHGEEGGDAAPSSARWDLVLRPDPVPPEDPVEVGTRDLPATHEIRVLGSVLRPTDSDATHSVSGSGGCVYATASPNTMFTTFVDLPHGATLLQARFYFNDTSDSDSFALLSEMDYQGFPGTEWRMDSWGNTGSGYDTRTDINHVVDTTTYSYVLRWRPIVGDATMQACGFRIWYHDPNIFSSGFETGDTFLWSSTVQ